MNTGWLGNTVVYIPDLSPFRYFRVNEPRFLAVGWLDPDYWYPQGETPSEFQARLSHQCRKPVQVTMGMHRCLFCGGVESCGEIRVGSAPRLVAPVMIIHYVLAHRYRPPQVFVDAVMRRGPTNNSPGDFPRLPPPTDEELQAWREGQRRLDLAMKIDNAVSDQLEQFESCTKARGWLSDHEAKAAREVIETLAWGIRDYQNRLDSMTRVDQPPTDCEDAIFTVDSVLETILKIRTYSEAAATQIEKILKGLIHQSDTDVRGTRSDETG